MGHAPKTERNTFTIPNPFPHDPKKNPTIEVVYASFAACIERENNGLRALTATRPEERDSLNATIKEAANMVRAYAGGYKRQPEFAEALNRLAGFIERDLLTPAPPMNNGVVK